MPVSLNFTIKPGVFSRTTLLGGVKVILCQNMKSIVADRFRNVATSQTGSGGRPLRRRRPKNIFLGCLRHWTRNFHTRCCWPSRAHCSNKNPTFDCKVWRYECVYVLHMLKRDAIWEVVFIECQVEWPWQSKRCRGTSLCNSATLHGCKDGRMILYTIDNSPYIAS